MAAPPPSDWLATFAPAGQHTFTFRYRPWDVPLGALLTLVGFAAALLAWQRAPAGLAAGVSGRFE
jgi:hypothetical protein